MLDIFLRGSWDLLVCCTISGGGSQKYTCCTGVTHISGEMDDMPPPLCACSLQVALSSGTPTRRTSDVHSMEEKKQEDFGVDGVDEFFGEELDQEGDESNTMADRCDLYPSLPVDRWQVSQV